MPVKHLIIRNLDEQIAIGNRFVQEYVERITKASEQRYQLGKFLLDYFRPIDSDYPIAICDFIETSQSPDCCFQLTGGKRIGLELTEATLQHLRDEEAAKLKVPPNKKWSYEVDPQTGEIKVGTKYEKDANGNVNELESNPLVGHDSSRIDWEIIASQLIIESIKRKRIKAQEWRDGVDIALLVILVHSTSMSFHRECVCQIVAENLNLIHKSLPFKGIFLISETADSQFAHWIKVDSRICVVKDFSSSQELFL